jgi:hypothetical protein
MLSKNGEFYFNLFKLPFNYNLNKDELKKNYYKLSKELHPDMKGDTKNYQLNSAYLILKDDFSRAKLFTKPIEKLNNKFLEKCIKLEEKIERGEDVEEKIKRKIEECKEKFDDEKSVGKWAYYERLKEKIRGLK